jgi:Tfp pilus assembly protein PilF
MSTPGPHRSGPSVRGQRPLTALASLLALALCGCSFDLGSLSSIAEKSDSPKPAPAAIAVTEAQAVTARAQTLARSGKTEEALAAFNNAIEIDPNNADAFYGRGLLYQGEKQHQLAVDDFTAANGLRPQSVTSR